VPVLPRWLGWALGLVVLACAAGLVVVLAVGHGGQAGTGTPTPAADAATLTAYTRSLAGPTKEGGRIVEQEMKPSLGDFAAGKLTAADFVVRARGWQLEMGRVRQQLDQVQAPPVIASAGPLFDVAIDAYIHAAGLFEQAGLAPSAQRQAAIAAAVAAARQADDDFDRAAAVVQRALAAAGLPADHSLPDVTATPLPS
jgi:hypothetical protein